MAVRCTRENMPRGSGELLVPLIRYIAILGNGGKALDEEAEGAVARNGDAESDLGNA
jgi:hypothetical protein